MIGYVTIGVKDMEKAKAFYGELLADMGRDFARSLDIEVTLQSALKRITEYLGAEGGALFLLEEDETILHCQCCVGATNITGLTLRADHGIVGRCVQNNAGEIVRDVAADSFSSIQTALEREAGRIPDHWWVTVSDDQQLRYDSMMRDARIKLRESGYYDATMLSIMKRIRCAQDAQRPECSQETE